MPDEDDNPLTEEELALAREGEALISAAVADVRAPQSLREAIERDRERATAQARAPFWRRHRWVWPRPGRWRPRLRPSRLRSIPGARRRNRRSTRSTRRRGSPRPRPLRRRSVAMPPVLDATVGNLEFPDWRKGFGWRAVGRRDDTLSGRPSRPSSIAIPRGRGSAMPSCPASPRRQPARPRGHAQGQDLRRRTGRRAHDRHLDAGGPHLRDRRPCGGAEARLVDLAASRNV